MALATLISLAAGMLLVGWTMATDGSFWYFIRPLELAITIGGTVAAAALQFSFSRLRSVPAIIRWAYASETEDGHLLVDLLAEHARRARRKGLLALQYEIGQTADPFLHKGLQLVVDGVAAETVRSILTREQESHEQQRKREASLFESCAEFAPAFGVVGTFFVLVGTLRGVTDPSGLAPAIGQALLPMLYAAIMANLIFLPLSGRIIRKSADEAILMRVIMEGLLLIQAGEQPDLVALQLTGMLPGEYLLAGTHESLTSSDLVELKE